MDREARGPIRFGIFEVDPQTRELRKRGVKVRLQEQPFQILTVLLEQAGQIVSREELRKRIWSADTFVDFDHGLYSAIKRLRDVLGDSAEVPRYIETVSKRGYRFISPVEAPSQTSVSKHMPLSVERGLQVHLPSRSARASFLGQRRFALVSVGTIVLAIGGIAAYPNLGSSAKTIVVLPFSYPADNSFLSGVSEKLTSGLYVDLNRISARGLKTKAPSNVDPFKGSDADPIAIGRQLNADLVVAGKLSKVAGQLSVDVDLLSVKDGSSLWAARGLRWETFEVESARRGILSELLTRLPIRLSETARAEVLRARPKKKVNPKAEELAAKAQEFFWVGTPESFAKSIHLNKDAISIDQDFAPSYGGIASAYIAMGNLEMIAPQEAKARMLEWANRGLQLDDVDFGSLIALHSAHYAMEWDAETLKENNFANGRFEKVREQNRRFQAENPNSPVSYLFMGQELLMERRFKEAIEHFRVALELDSHRAWAHYYLGTTYLYQHRYKEALAEFDLSAKGLPVHSLTGTIVTLAEEGKRRDAIHKAEELKTLSRSQYVSPLMFARVGIALRDKNKAFRELKAACDDRVPPLLNLKVDPAWDTLRKDRRFEEIVRCVGL